MLREDTLEYYRQHSPATDPKEHAALFESLPHDLPDLHQIVQNVLIHVWKIRKYHSDWLAGRTHEIESRTISDLLTLIQQHDPQPLTVERPREKKLIVDCRHFAGLLCAMLRHQNIPARVRNGFATYLTDTHYQDHWVCEYWNGERWLLEDPDLVMHDIPRDQFMVAGQVWAQCRAGETDPNRYGYSPEWCGLWVIRNNLIRDLAALNKVEEMSLALWGLILDSPETLSAEMLQALDRAAAATLDASSNDPRTVYESSPLRAPTTVEIHNYVSDTHHSIQISA